MGVLAKGRQLGKACFPSQTSLQRRKRQKNKGHALQEVWAVLFGRILPPRNPAGRKSRNGTTKQQENPPTICTSCLWGSLADSPQDTFASSLSWIYEHSVQEIDPHNTNRLQRQMPAGFGHLYREVLQEGHLEEEKNREIWSRLLELRKSPKEASRKSFAQSLSICGPLLSSQKKSKPTTTPLAANYNLLQWIWVRKLRNWIHPTTERSSVNFNVRSPGFLVKGPLVEMSSVSWFERRWLGTSGWSQPPILSRKHCATDGRRTDIQMGGVVKLVPFPGSSAGGHRKSSNETYCNANWKSIAIPLWRKSGNWVSDSLLKMICQHLRAAMEGAAKPISSQSRTCSWLLATGSVVGYENSLLATVQPRYCYDNGFENVL